MLRASGQELLRQQAYGTSQYLQVVCIEGVLALALRDKRVISAVHQQPHSDVHVGPAAATCAPPHVEGIPNINSIAAFA